MAAQSATWQACSPPAPGVARRPAPPSPRRCRPSGQAPRRNTVNLKEPDPRALVGRLAQMVDCIIDAVHQQRAGSSGPIVECQVRVPWIEAVRLIEQAQRHLGPTLVHPILPEHKDRMGIVAIKRNSQFQRGCDSSRRSCNRRTIPRTSWASELSASSSSAALISLSARAMS
jgi:hypothetical protein